MASSNIFNTALCSGSYSFDFQIYDVFPVDLKVNSAKNRFRLSIQPLTILGVTGPFSVLAENIYTLCQESFQVSVQVLFLYFSDLKP